MDRFESLHPRDTSGRFVPKDVHEQSAGMGVLAPTPGLESRRQALLNAAMVPAVVLPTAELGDVDQWWDAHYVAAEYDARRPIPQMSAMDERVGHRVARKTYNSDDVSLTMPNAASIRRYARDSGASAFDVPVSGTVNGKGVSGWVRVQEVRPGVWVSRLVGQPGHPIGEAVSAVLESRRVTHALREAGDLIERRRKRLASAGTGVDPVESSWVSAVGYDRATRTMVTQVSDRVYGHLVPEHLYEAVRKSSSPGAAFNRLIKGSPRASVQRCDSCSRFYADGAEHVCASGSWRPREADRDAHIAARTRAVRVADLALGDDGAQRRFAA